MSHYLEYIFGEPSSSDEEEEEIYFEEGEEELELIEEGEEQDQPITDSILVQTQSEKKNKVKAKHNYQFKKENNGKGEVIIIPPTKEELEKEAKEREEQDLYDWDKIYNKLMNKKVNAIKFTMKDVECHKMNYDKLFYQLNNNQDDDYEEEDDDQEENHTEQGSSTSTVNLEDVEEKKKKKKKKKKNVNNVLKNQIDLGLKKMAGMSFGSYLVFYGGYKVGKGYYPQLVALDRKNNKWIDVKKRIDFMRDYLAKKLGNQNFYYNGNYVDVYYSPPPFVNYFAFNCGSYFVLFDGNNTCCYIRDFLDLLNLTEKTFLHQQKQQPTTEVKYYWKKITEIEHLNYGKTQFKQTINHSCSNIGSTVYVFGGRDVNTRRLVNQLTSCSITEGGVNNRYRNSSRTLVLQKKIINVSGAPCPRENHAQCCVGDCIYIYGGNFNNENQLLNDLHCFNIKYNMWTQIELNLLAPPLRNHTFSNGLAQYLYLIGGYLSNGEVNDVLYRFNIKENSFEVVNPGGTSPSASVVNTGSNFISPKALQKPRAEHLTIEDGKQLVIAGGVTTGNRICKENVILNEILDVGVENSSYVYLKKTFEKQFNGEFAGFDLALLVAKRGSGESEYIYCNKTILSNRSTYFKELLSEIDFNDFESLEHIEELNIPILKVHEYYYDSLIIYIRYLYCGDLVVGNETNNECLQELLLLGKRDPERHNIIAKLCDQQKVLYLDSSTEVLTKLREDFTVLYKQIEESLDNPLSFEPSNDNYYTDVTIQLLDPHTDEIMHELRAHKILLCKSTYIKTVFESGMEESQLGIIKFSEISLNGLLSVIRYLYTNEMVISIESCIEVLVTALLFQLFELANYCRNVIQNNITVENVIDICNIVELYNDTPLRGHCIRFILQHYDTISLASNYETLSEPTRSDIRMRKAEQIRRSIKSSNKTKQTKK